MSDDVNVKFKKLSCLLSQLCKHAALPLGRLGCALRGTPLAMWGVTCTESLKSWPSMRCMQARVIVAVPFSLLIFLTLLHFCMREPSCWLL